MGVLLETIFRSKLLTQKKSMNGLHKRLSINKRLSTSWQALRSLTLEKIPMDSYKQHHRQPQAIKHLKFLRLPYLNPCLKLHPTSKFHKNPYSNLRSNLRSSLRSSPDLQTASLISSNSHPFLYKHSISFRRFSMEGDSKTPVVPKVAIEVATSV